MKRCKNNHFYDDSLSDVCPICNGENDYTTVSLKTRPTNNRPVTDSSLEKSYAGAFDKNFKSEGYLDHLISDSNNSETVSVYQKTKGFDPVVGWLVCVEGASIGKDFIIKAERNFIGSDATMDIRILGDNSISAKKHAIISFNPKELIYRIAPGDSHGIVYVNNQEVFSPETLKHGDLIQIGQTTLMFVPLCNENFSW